MAEENQFQFSTLDKLNACANSETPGYVKFDALEINQPYKIHKFGTFESANFDKKQTHLTAYIDQGYLILPERFNTLVNGAEELNCEKLHIVVKGREKKRLNIEFKEI